MNLQQINHAFTSTLDLVAGLAVPSAIGYAGGYLYGVILNADKQVAARAFTISLLILYVFQAITHYATLGERKNLKHFYATQLLGIGILGTIQIVVYRKLNLISTVGTAVMSAFLLVGSLVYLNKLEKFYRADTQAP